MTGLFKYSIVLLLLGGILVGGVRANGKGLPGNQEKHGVMERAATSIFNKALENYQKGIYWKCTLDLVVILDYYPQFSKIDGVLFYLGNCLYELEMYQGADRLYRYLLKNIPSTRYLPNALLGLQKIYYQKGDYTQSLKFYKALEAHYSNYEIISESRYYAGQSYYHLGNFSVVPKILQQVSSRSEFYPFALYTMGLAQLKKKAYGNPSKHFKKLLHFQS